MKNNIPSLTTLSVDFEPYKLEIIRKRIKHVYFRIYPLKEKIIISVPFQLDLETVDSIICSKSGWLKQQIKKNKPVKPIPEKRYISGENLWFKGKRYALSVNLSTSPSKKLLLDGNRICMTVKPDWNVCQRERVLHNWYRKELKAVIAKIIAHWQPIIGVTINEFGVRKMKTRWGSCNICAKRIWLNFSLIQFSDSFLEYVVVHEMVHLIERQHNARFKGLMDHFIPGWRDLKKEMNSFRMLE